MSPAWFLVSVACLGFTKAGAQTSADSELNLAMKLRGAGQLREALGHAEQAVRIAPQMTRAHFVLAGLAGDLCLPNSQPGRDERVCDLAIEEYEATIRLEPAYSSALKDLAFLLYGFFRLNEAEGYYRRALSASPEDAEVLAGLAAIDLARSWPDLMVARVSEGVWGPGFIETGSCPGVRLAHLARVEEGIAFSLRAIRVRSRDSDLMRRLAVFYTARSELHCGDRRAHRADRDQARKWSRRAQAVLRSGSQDPRPFKAPPGPPP